MITKKEFDDLEMPLEYTRSPRPDKVHIGLVRLSTEQTLEADWAKLSGSSALVYSSRVYYSSVLSTRALGEIA